MSHQSTVPFSSSDTINYRDAVQPGRSQGADVAKLIEMGQPDIGTKSIHEHSVDTVNH